MKKLLLLLPLLILLGCQDALEINLTCVLWHTTQVVTMQSDLLEEGEHIFVTLTWRWTYETPQGDAIIIKRSIGDSTSFTEIDTVWQIDTLMNYIDDDSVLTPNSTVYYRLAFLTGKAVDDFITTDVAIPDNQNFYEPTQDTLSGDTLYITFKQLSGFDACSVSVFNTFTTEPESLIQLLNPVFDTALSYPDTTLAIAISDPTNFPNNTTYTIKISSSKVVELITDSSYGFRAFFKLP